MLTIRDLRCPECGFTADKAGDVDCTQFRIAVTLNLALGRAPCADDLMLEGPDDDQLSQESIAPGDLVTCGNCATMQPIEKYEECARAYNAQRAIAETERALIDGLTTDSCIARYSSINEATAFRDGMALGKQDPDSELLVERIPEEECWGVFAVKQP